MLETFIIILSLFSLNSDSETIWFTSVTGDQLDEYVALVCKGPAEISYTEHHNVLKITCIEK